MIKWLQLSSKHTLSFFFVSFFSVSKNLNNVFLCLQYLLFFIEYIIKDPTFKFFFTLSLDTTFEIISIWITQRCFCYIIWGSTTVGLSSLIIPDSKEMVVVEGFVSWREVILKFFSVLEFRIVRFKSERCWL